MPGFPTDRELQARVVLALLAVVGLYLGFVAAALSDPEDRAWEALVVVAVVVVVHVLIAPRLALHALQARDPSPAELARVLPVLDRLCALADLPRPRLALADLPEANALVVGRSRRTSTLVLTPELLRRLPGDELEAVLAHELAHVDHRDAPLMTAAAGLGVLAGGLERGCSAVLRAAGTRGSRTGVLRLLGLALTATLLASAWLLRMTSALLLSFLGRSRELAADRAAALLTRRPAALASALVHVDESTGLPTADLRVSGEVRSLALVAPRRPDGTTTSGLLATHPPLPQRLERLARLTRGR